MDDAYGAGRLSLGMGRWSWRKEGQEEGGKKGFGEKKRKEKKRKEKNIYIYIKGVGKEPSTYLKSMQQPEPMPDLVHGRLAQVIPVHLLPPRDPRHAPRQDVAPVGRVILFWVFSQGTTCTGTRTTTSAATSAGGGGGRGRGGDVCDVSNVGREGAVAQ